MNHIADILVTHSGKKQIFSYTVPKELVPNLRLGLVVIVPFRQSKIHGVVVRIDSKPPRFLKSLKSIIKIVHSDLSISDNQLKTAKWMSEYFVASYADCVFSFLPILQPPPKEVAQESRITNHESRLKLNAEQEKALEIIRPSKKPVLLHGVTGSGKTEVYLRFANELLDAGKPVLMLVPEIALTPQTKKRFESRFGDKVAVWHSELSQRERRTIWWQVKYGQKTLVVGSRSAVFLPFSDLGLIVIDEEHEKSFYQESSPRYDVREVAEYMNRTFHTQLVLGSATPRLETVWKASSNQYALARLSTRIGASLLPDTRIVDLRQERLETGKTISRPLAEALQKTLEEKRQAVLLLNRRGHSTTAQCTTCGLLMLCQNCNVPLVVHDGASNRPELRCHHCDHKEPAPAVCPSCHTPTLSFMGFGTEKAEHEIRDLLPEARILRMDRDTTRTRDVIDSMYHDFASHKYDILLGTQMIAKGWDIPKVDLVGILLAEGGLMLPDFHAAENTFNLLVQVSGRSGRGADRGMTMMQTYMPDQSIIRAAAGHDFGTFVKEELKNRKEFAYPPFSHIVRLLYQDANKDKSAKETTRVAHYFEKITANTEVEVLGPTACFFERLRGKYRHHIILKIKDAVSLKQLCDEARALPSPWTIEVDPPQLL